jgi:large subunit ribosomal protein L6
MVVKYTNIGQIPKNVIFSLDNDTLNIKGKYSNIDISISGLKLVISKKNDLILYYKSSLLKDINVIVAKIKNALIGVSYLFKVKLSIVGVGYRFSLNDNTLSMRVGYNHLVDVTIKENIICKVMNSTEIILLSNDLQNLVLFCSNIRNLKKPEVYKGKGIRFSTEIIRLKKPQMK